MDGSLVSAIISTGDDSGNETEWIENWPPPLGLCNSTKTVSLTSQVGIFRRDSFTCQYCGRRTVTPPILRLLSIGLGKRFLFQKNGKMQACHRGFWRDIASCDHIVPFALSGDSGEKNLVTACYMCNTMKSGFLFEELDWQRPPLRTVEGWDGLSSQFPKLLEIVESRTKLSATENRYFAKWSTALKTTTDVDPVSLL